jgi:aminopeptidase N
MARRLLASGRSPARSVLLLLLLAACSQTVRADEYAPDPRVDVLHYAFRLDLQDASDEIIGETTLTVQFAEDGVSEIVLDLVGRARRGARTGMTVTSVLAGGAPVAYVHAADRVRLPLPSPSRAGQELQVAISYRGVPADGLIVSRNKHGDRTFFADNWPDRARHWLPTVDHPSEKATCEFIVTAPDHYEVVSNGRLVEKTDLPNGVRLTHWRTTAPLPTKVMVIGVARFSVEHLGSVEGVDVESWVYPQDREAGPRDLAAAPEILRFFIEQIGPYPYEKLAHVQSTTRYGGMENAGAIFYHEDAITGSGLIESLIAHEVAHQWFGNSVTERSWHHLWLSEGFATYLAEVYMGSAYGIERYEAGMRQARAGVLAFHRQNPSSSVIDTTITDLMRLLNTNTYQKGAWVLRMLRQKLGDDAFWTGMRTFYARYRDGNALTSDFRHVMEEVSGRDMEGFFHQWLYRPQIPRVVGTWQYAEGEISLTLRQTHAGGPFRLPVDVAVFMGGSGSPQIEVVTLTEEEGIFTLPVSSAPDRVVLDPDQRLLMEAEINRR